MLIAILLIIVVNFVDAYNFRNQTGITTATWHVFHVLYDDTSGNQPARMPKDDADTTTIANFNADTHMIGSRFSPIERNNLLNWASQNGQGIDLMNSRFYCWIRSETSCLTIDIDAEVQNFVSLHASHPAYKGVNLGDEPYGGLIDSARDAAPARAKTVIDLFKRYDSNINHRYYFNTAGGMPIMRHCREASPDIMLSSGAGYLRDPSIPEKGNLYHSHYDKVISIFDEEYLCTDNYAIPFGYSIAANNWGGQLNADEARMITYLMLAHGGKFALWFVYGTTYGFVWEANNPLIPGSYFTFWAPAIQGGRRWVNPSNTGITVDSTTARSGTNSLKITALGTSDIGNSFYVYGNSYFGLQDSTAYALSAWIKSDCTTCEASVKVEDPWSGGSENYICPSVIGSTFGSWVQVTCNFVTPATGNFPFSVYLTFRSTGTGNVWVDDVSLRDIGRSHEVLSSYNPGFEKQYGQDRRSHFPSYSTLKQLNSELKQLSPELMPLKKIESSNNYNIPNKSVIKSIDVSLNNNLDTPLVEYGLLTDNDVNGKLYLILVNRVIVDDALVTLNINSNQPITPVNVLTGISLGTFNPSNGIVTFNLNLNRGDGIVLRLENLKYNKEGEGSILYAQDFSSGNLNDFTYDQGYSVENIGGNDMLFADAFLSTQNIWLNNYKFSDFILTGRFRINLAVNPISLFYFGFRQKNPNSLNDAYILAFYPDPAPYQNGFLAIIRNFDPWHWDTRNDQKFLKDTNWHSFKIIAYGGKLEAYIDNIKYLSVVDNYINRSGFIGVSTHNGNQLFFDDIVIKEIIKTNEYTLNLNTGLNLISIPIAVSNNNINDLFQPILSNIRNIYSYDSLTSSWKVYHSNQAIPSSLATIEPNKAYFILMDSPASLTITGDLTTPSRQLGQGWNLISIFGISPRTIEQEFTTNPVFNSIWSFDPVTRSYSEIPSSSYNTYLLQPGQGYWVYVP